MEYIKKSINEDNFQIDKFFEQIDAKNKNDGDKAFRAIIENILCFDQTRKHKYLISFARSVKEANYGILESEAAYAYWSRTIEKRNTLKRVFEHLSREERITDELIKTTNKVQKTEEEPTLSPDSDVSQSRSTILADIWSIWSEFLQFFLTDNKDDKDINSYSLEYLGIIQLGHKVGNRQTRASYPKDLVATSNKILGVNKQDVFSKFRPLYDDFFGTLTESVDECHKKLLKNSLRVLVTNDSSLSFCYEFFMIFVTQVFKYPAISKLESVYNFRVVFRFLDAVAMGVPNCEFIPGEARLKAITEELKRQALSKKSYYNADGIIFNNQYGKELVLVETSGPFGHEDTNRETTDHVKAAYGLLAMLHTVAYTYIYADSSIFKQLKVCFVHAASNRIRVWTFSLASKELYVLNRVSSSILPTNHSDSKDNVMEMTNMMWDLKRTVEEASEVLRKIKESHEKNEQIVQGNPDSQIERLDSFLVDVAEVKLSSRVSQADDIYVFRSPFQPDSPIDD